MRHSIAGGQSSEWIGLPAASSQHLPAPSETTCTSLDLGVNEIHEFVTDVPGSQLRCPTGRQPLPVGGFLSDRHGFASHRPLFRILLRTTLKVRLAKRQRQHSIPPLNLEKFKEEKAVQFAAEVTNRFTALEAAQDDVTLESVWKGIKAVLLEVVRETIGCVKSQKKTKSISDETFAAIREKRETKGKDKNRYQELQADVLGTHSG